MRFSSVAVYDNVLYILTLVAVIPFNSCWNKVFLLTISVTGCNRAVTHNSVSLFLHSSYTSLLFCIACQPISCLPSFLSVSSLLCCSTLLLLLPLLHLICLCLSALFPLVVPSSVYVSLSLSLWSYCQVSQSSSSSSASRSLQLILPRSQS